MRANPVGGTMTRKAETQVQPVAVDNLDDNTVPDRDLVGTYLHEISRTPLLDAEQEVELSKAVEAGLYAEHLLLTDQVPGGVTKVELKRLVTDGGRAKDAFILANLAGRVDRPAVHAQCDAAARPRAG